MAEDTIAVPPISWMHRDESATGGAYTKVAVIETPHGTFLSYIYVGYSASLYRDLVIPKVCRRYQPGRYTFGVMIERQTDVRENRGSGFGLRVRFTRLKTARLWAEKTLRRRMRGDMSQ